VGEEGPAFLGSIGVYDDTDGQIRKIPGANNLQGERALGKQWKSTVGIVNPASRAAIAAGGCRD
jgi:hypothetical protein